MRRLPYNLQNTYYLMRHGRSIPNEKGIIVSKIENGVNQEHGLSDYGKDQSRQAAKASGLPSDTIIYTSDFSRTHQTAKIVADEIGANQPVVSTELRERDFGELELKSSNSYGDVWRCDIAGEAYGRGVESMDDVADRAVRLIEGMENVHRGKTILLVSHGDTLQAIQTVYHRLHPALDYNQVQSLDNAEIKLLNKV